MKTALILGVSGQDGAYLARFLLDKGYTVFGGSRDAQMQSFAASGQDYEPGKAWRLPDESQAESNVLKQTAHTTDVSLLDG